MILNETKYRHIKLLEANFKFDRNFSIYTNQLYHIMSSSEYSMDNYGKDVEKFLQNFNIEPDNYEIKTSKVMTNIKFNISVEKSKVEEFERAMFKHTIDNEKALIKFTSTQMVALVDEYDEILKIPEQIAVNMNECKIRFSKKSLDYLMNKTNSTNDDLKSKYLDGLDDTLYVIKDSNEYFTIEFNKDKWNSSDKVKDDDTLKDLAQSLFKQISTEEETFVEGQLKELNKDFDKSLYNFVKDKYSLLYTPGSEDFDPSDNYIPIGIDGKFVNWLLVDDSKKQKWEKLKKDLESMDETAQKEKFGKFLNNIEAKFTKILGFIGGMVSGALGGSAKTLH